MTTRVWSGAVGDFFDPSQWSGGFVPGAGDTVVINSGTVNAGSVSFSNEVVEVIASGGVSSTLDLGLTIDAGSTLTLSDQVSGATTPLASAQFRFVTNYGMIAFVGSNTLLQGQKSSDFINDGTLSLRGSRAVLDFGGGISDNNGVINLSGTSAEIESNSTFVPLSNNGLIRVTNPSDGAQSALVSGNLSGFGGVGTVSVSVNASLEFAGLVGNDQTLVFNGGRDANSMVQLDDPGQFFGSVDGFVSGDSINLIGINYMNAAYVSTGSSSGRLVINNGFGGASISFSGVYSLSSFGFQVGVSSSGQSTVRVTTSVLNAATGSTSSAGPGSVYRFFDNVTGTHFLTASPGERDSLLTTLTGRFVEETNGFGAASSTDSGAVLVYRFFDSKGGTQFFTSSANEAASLQNPNSSAYRPDLTYEAGSSFYEHSSAQAGDVTVYRFFDTTYGTHFYTGNAGEFNAITNSALATYRPDLVYEPSGNFYAPAGSFI